MTVKLTRQRGIDAIKERFPTAQFEGFPKAMRKFMYEGLRYPFKPAAWLVRAWKQNPSVPEFVCFEIYASYDPVARKLAAYTDLWSAIDYERGELTVYGVIGLPRPEFFKVDLRDATIRLQFNLDDSPQSEAIKQMLGVGWPESGEVSCDCDPPPRWEHDWEREDEEEAADNGRPAEEI